MTPFTPHNPVAPSLRHCGFRLNQCQPPGSGPKIHYLSMYGEYRGTDDFLISF